MSYKSLGDVYGKLGVKFYDDYRTKIEPRIELAKKLASNIDNDDLKTERILILNKIENILKVLSRREEFDQYWFQCTKTTKFWKVKLFFNNLYIYM